MKLQTFPEKTCTKCKKTKTLAHFYSDSRRPLGVFPYCKECCKKRDATWRRRNKERDRARYSAWSAENKKHRRDYQRVWAQNSRRTTIHGRLKNNIRARIAIALAGKAKSTSITKNFGCSLSDLRAYLEQKFTNGMTWENYGRGGWQIDHIIPLAFFDLSDPAQLRTACHFTNLQPLWEQDHFHKTAIDLANMEGE